VGEALRAGGVTDIYLVHGTFVGCDTLGLAADMARFFPQAAEALERVSKAWIDEQFGDAGNYTPQFAQLLAQGINRPGAREIGVELFQWSGENHHLGRADGAVRLIAELASQNFAPGSRVLLWGHSHAGNVFALMTNLLASPREAVAEFFKAAEPHYRWPGLGIIDIPLWNHVRELLARENPLRDVELDLVTFGTPIRYGWESGGYDRLVHFINHHPLPGVPEYLAQFPPSVDDILHAVGGDYIQQLGIAGTNLPPSLMTWRSFWADHRLGEFLQPGLDMSGLPERLSLGARVPDEGTTLLVDYGRPGGGIAEHHAGHALYTRVDWLLFHAEEVARQLYDLSQPLSAAA